MPASDADACTAPKLGETMFERIEEQYLDGVTVDFVDPGQRNILSRWDRHDEWFQGRLRSGVDPYSKFTSSSIATECTAGTRDGRSVEGVNFGSQEYLNLASHPAVHAVARDAIDAFGVHSAG